MWSNLLSWLFDQVENRHMFYNTPYSSSYVSKITTKLIISNTFCSSFLTNLTEKHQVLLSIVTTFSFPHIKFIQIGLSISTKEFRRADLNKPANKYHKFFKTNISYIVKWRPTDNVRYLQSNYSYSLCASPVIPPFMPHLNFNAPAQRVTFVSAFFMKSLTFNS